MYWLLLPVAVLALFMGLRTPSPALMALWLLAMLASLGGWLWLRYRQLFPERPAVELTPLDPAELARLRAQTAANRDAAEAARRAAEAEAEAAHPIHPVTPTVHIPPPVMPAPAPEPAPMPQRPVTGRAIFALPDDPPRIISPGDRPL